MRRKEKRRRAQRRQDAQPKKRHLERKNGLGLAKDANTGSTETVGNQQMEKEATITVLVATEQTRTHVPKKTWTEKSKKDRVPEY